MKVETDTVNDSYWIIKVCPFGLLVLAIALNFLFGIEPIKLFSPSKQLIGFISCAAIILVINHSWIMTVTELTQVRFKIFASPGQLAQWSWTLLFPIARLGYTLLTATILMRLRQTS